MASVRSGGVRLGAASAHRRKLRPFWARCVVLLLVPQRAGARSERLLPVFRAHGAAPRADPGVPTAAARWHSRHGCSGRCSGRRGVFAVSRGPSHGPGVAAAPLQCRPSPSGICRPFYDLMMRNHEVHIVTHLMFMVTATIMWWPVMSSVPELPRLPRLARHSVSCSWSGFRCRSWRIDHVCRSRALPLVRPRAENVGAFAVGRSAAGRTADVDPG